MSETQETPPIKQPSSPENPDAFGSTGTSGDDALIH